MSVVSVVEIDGREVERSENMNRRINRSYRIRCDRPDEDEASVIIGADMPVILAPHPTVPALRCTSVRCTQQTDNDPFVWIAKVTWASLVLSRRAANTSADPSKRNENPLLRPAIVSFGTERFQKAATVDINGKAILNSAGDPFETGVLYDDFRPTFTVTRNVPSWSIADWMTATNRVNENTFLGISSGRVRLVNLTGQESFENDTPFYIKTGTFHVSSAANWVIDVLDCGYQGKTGLGNKFAISLPDGTKPSTPVRLDGAGTPLNPGDPSHFVGFEIYDTYDFDDLGFF